MLAKVLQKDLNLGTPGLQSIEIMLAGSVSHQKGTKNIHDHLKHHQSSSPLINSLGLQTISKGNKKCQCSILATTNVREA